MFLVGKYAGPKTGVSIISVASKILGEISGRYMKEIEENKFISMSVLKKKATNNFVKMY